MHEKPYLLGYLHTHWPTNEFTCTRKIFKWLIQFFKTNQLKMQIHSIELRDFNRIHNPCVVHVIVSLPAPDVGIRLSQKVTMGSGFGSFVIITQSISPVNFNCGFSSEISF